MIEEEMLYEIKKLYDRTIVLGKENEQLKQKIDKAIEYINSKIKEQKELPDYSKYYLENYDKAIQETHSSHSGILLETIKSTTIKRYEDLLEILGDKGTISYKLTKDNENGTTQINGEWYRVDKE